jgi:hypothetical protein
MAWRYNTIDDVLKKVFIRPEDKACIRKGMPPAAAAAAAAVPAARAAAPPAAAARGAVLDDFITLEKLNAFIDSNKYPPFNKPNNRDEQLVPSGKDKYGPYKNGITLECMQTSGNNLDCLIHAFLMSTCPAFRRRIRMDGPHVTNECGAKQFATAFRKQVAPSIIDAAFDLLPNKANVRKENLKAQLLQDAYQPGDLENEHLIIFSAYYRINTLIFAIKGRGYPIVVPRIFQYGGDTPTYILSNLGGHYESVRVFKTNDYTIPLVTARSIVNEVEHSSQGEFTIEYSKGDPIPIEKTNAHGGQGEYYVYDIRYKNDSMRAEYYIASTNHEEVQEYLEYLQKQRNISEDIPRNITAKDKEKWGSDEKIEEILQGIPFSAEDIESDDFKLAVAAAEPARAVGPLAVANFAKPTRFGAAGPAAVAASAKPAVSTLAALAKAASPANVAAVAKPSRGKVSKSSKLTPEEKEELDRLRAKKAAWEAYQASQRKGGSRRRRTRKRRA